MSDGIEVMTYKASCFDLWLDLSRDYVGVYNTLYDSAVAIPREHCPEASKIADVEEPEIRELLIDHKILVPSRLDESDCFRSFIHERKHFPTRATFVLCTTADCNLRCPYCFEGASNIQKHMTAETLAATLSYIRSTLQEHTSISEVDLAFFGGEPMLNRVCVQDACDALAVDPFPCKSVRYSITTNLTILTHDDIELFKRYRFSNVQVALDGPQEIHDKRRHLASGEGTFLTIVNNIKRLVSSGIYVIVILNFDRQNLGAYPAFINELSTLLPASGVEYVLNPISKSFCNQSCASLYLDDAEQACAYQHLYRLLRSVGMSISGIARGDMLCMLSTDVSCVISSDGSIYKCCLMLGQPEYGVGNVAGSHDPGRQATFIDARPWESCLSNGCVYLPVCGGGCRALAMMKNGTLTSIDCQKKTYYTGIYHEFLENRLREQLNAEVEHEGEEESDLVEQA